MGKYRIYPSKSNSIIEGKRINTGENEVMELWYGSSGIARHLVKVDFDVDVYKQRHIVFFFW